MFTKINDSKIWQNGKFLDWQNSSVHSLTHTLHYGVGVFEGVRAYKGDQGTAIFRLQDHTDRLFKAAEIVNIKIPYSKEELNKVQCEILHQNRLQEAYLRPIIYLGDESMGLRAEDLSVNVIIAAWEWPSYMDPQSKVQGISMVKSSFPQYKNPLWSNHKITGTYVNSVVALQDAVSKGADEALMFDDEGFVSEGTGENIFFFKDNILRTPSIRACLNGITRQSIISIAKDFGYKVEEGDWTYNDLIESDEIFLTGTAVEVTPVTKIDNEIISNGFIGNLTRKIQSKYQSIIVGNEKHYLDWLTFI